MFSLKMRKFLATVLAIAMTVSSAGFNSLAMSINNVTSVRSEVDSERQKTLSYRYYQQYKAENVRLLMNDEENASESPTLQNEKETKAVEGVSNNIKKDDAGAGAEQSSTDKNEETITHDSESFSVNKDENKDKNIVESETNSKHEGDTYGPKVSTDSDTEDDENNEETTNEAEVEEPEVDETTKVNEEEATATTSDAENENEDNENNEEAEEDTATVSDAEKVDDEEDEKEEKVATDSDADNIDEDVNEATASDVNVDETGSVATVSEADTATVSEADTATASEADTATASEFSLIDLKPLVASESDTNLFGADSIYNVGDKVYFGRYLQHNNGGQEPIEWHIVAKSGDTATLLADKVLFKDSLHGDNTKTKYKDTTLKSYLNSTIYNSSMFNNDERSAILQIDDKRGKIGIPNSSEMYSWVGQNSDVWNSKDASILGGADATYWLSDDAMGSIAGAGNLWYIYNVGSNKLMYAGATSHYSVRLCIKVDLTNDVFVKNAFKLNWNLNLYSRSINWKQSDIVWASMTEYRGTKYMTLPKKELFDEEDYLLQGIEFEGYFHEKPGEDVIVGFDENVNVNLRWMDANRGWYTLYNMYSTETNTYGKIKSNIPNRETYISLDPTVKLPNKDDVLMPQNLEIESWDVDGSTKELGATFKASSELSGFYWRLTPNYKIGYKITWDLYDGTSTTVKGSWNGTAGPDEYTSRTGLDPLPTNVTGPTGRQFDHWEIGGTKVTKISTTDTGKKTIKAVYKDISYNINYKERKSSLHPTKTTTRKYSDSYTLDLSPSWSRTGFTFSHWNNAEDDKKITKIEAKTAKDITVYPVWKENEYKIYYFDSRTATTPMKVATRSYTSAGVLDRTATWEKTGYKFAYWRNKTDNSAIMHVEANTTLDVMVYAEWSEKTYNIKYLDDKNSTVVRKTVTRRYTEGKDLDKIASWTKSGYHFINWKNNENDEVVTNVVANTATDISLYPVWERGYIFPATWITGVTDDLSGVTTAEMSAITKITFSKNPASAPTGYTKTWDIANSGGLKGYLYSDRVVVYAPEDLTIYMDPNVTNEYFSPAMYGGSNVLSKVKTVENFNLLDTSKMTSMQGMFSDMGALESIDLSNFDTSKVTNMRAMFNQCISLKNLDLSSFDTSNVENMSFMFNNTQKLETVDLTSFNTSKVTDMSFMFNSAKKLTTIIVSSDFVTTKVTSSGEMFNECDELVGINGTKYSVALVKDASYAVIDGALGKPGYFSEEVYTLTGYWIGGRSAGSTTYDAPDLETVKTLKKITFSKYPEVEPTGASFTWDIYKSNGLKGYIVGDEAIIYAPKDKKIFLDKNASMFFSVLCGEDYDNALANVEEINNLGIIDTSKTTDMKHMFYLLRSVKVLNLGSFDTSKVTDMSSMFEGCTKLEDILVDGTKFVTTNVTASTDMFKDCVKLTGRFGTKYTNVIVTGEDHGFGNQDKTFARIDGGWKSTTPGYFCDITKLRVPAFWRNNKDSNSYYHPTWVAENVVEGSLGLAPNWYEELGFSLDKKDITLIAITGPDGAVKKNGVLTEIGDEGITEVKNVPLLRGDTQIATYSFVLKGTELYIRSANDTNVCICAFGTYIEDISGLFEGFESVEMIYDTGDSFNDAIHNGDRSIGGCDIGQHTVYARNLFKDCYKLKFTNLCFGQEVTDLNDTEGMFENCYELPDEVFAHFFRFMNKFAQTRNNFKSLKNMFKNCKSLTNISFSDKFRTSEVTDMTSMFEGCENIKVLNLGVFNTANVTDMTSMFEGCTKLEDILVDGTKFVTTNVTASTDMFKDCFELTGRFGTKYTRVVVTGEDHGFGNKDKEFARIDGGWKSTTPGYFCDVAKERVPAFWRNNKDANGYSHPTWTYGSNYLEGCLALVPGWYEELGFNLDKKDVTQIIISEGMSIVQNGVTKMIDEVGATEVKYVPLYKGDTQISSYSFILKGTDLYVRGIGEISGRDYYAVVFGTYIEDISGLFEGFEGAERIWYNGDSFEAVIDNDRSTSGCDFGQYTRYARNLFKDCHNLKFTNLCFGQEVIDLDDAEGMFENCYELPDEVFTHFFRFMNKFDETHNKLKNLKNMFKNCKSLTNISFSDKFDTSLTTDMSSMFEGCENLEKIMVVKKADGTTSFDVTNVTQSTYMFKDTYKLQGSRGSAFTTYGVRDKAFAKVDGGSGDPGYFTLVLKNTSNKVYLRQGWYTSTYDKANVTEINFKVSDNISNYYDETFVIDTTNNTYGYRHDSVIDIYADTTNKKVYGDGSWNALFKDFTNLNSIDFTNVDTKEVNNMASLFENDENLTNINFTNFNTASVSDMSMMFKNVKNIDTLNLSTFDTRKVTNMTSMFEGVENVKVLNLGVFNTAKVTDMTSMFEGCTKLEDILVDGNKFKTTNVTASTDMFKNCVKLTGRVGTRYTNVVVTGEDHGFGNQDVTFARIDTGWDTTTPGYFCDVTKPRPEAFFRNNKDSRYSNDGTTNVNYAIPCAGLAPGWYEELGFTTDKTTITKIQMLLDDQARAKLSGNATEIRYAYEYVGDAKVATFSFIIDGTELYITNGLKADGNRYEDGVTAGAYMVLIPTYLEDLSGLFEGFTHVESIKDSTSGLSQGKFYTESVVDGAYIGNTTKYARNLFKDCQNLDMTNLAIGPNSNNLIDVEGLFENCQKLPDDVAKNFFSWMNTDTRWPAKLKNMKNLFKDCKSLTELNLATFDTTETTDMTSMFEGVENVKVLNLGTFNTANVTDMTKMFAGCTKLEDILVDGTKFATASVTASTDMFKDCVKLTGKIGSRYSRFGNQDVTFARIDTGWDTTTPGYFGDVNEPRIEAFWRNNKDAVSIVSGADWIGEKAWTSLGFAPGWYEELGFVLPKEDVTSIKLLTESQVRTFDRNSLTEEKYVNVYLGNNRVATYSFMLKGTELYVTNGLDASGNIYNLNQYRCYSFYFPTYLEDISGLFEGFTNLESIMDDNEGFYSNAKFTGPFILSHVKTAKNVFKDCHKLKMTNFGINVHADNLEDIEGMFENCYELPSDVVNNFFKYMNTDTRWTTKLKNMKNLFKDCKSLTELNLATFDTTETTDMTSMFDGCENLAVIYVDETKFTTNNVVNSQDMFNNCPYLIGGEGTAYAEFGNRDKSFAVIDKGEAKRGYLSIKSYVLKRNWFNKTVAGISPDAVEKIRFASFSEVAPTGTNWTIDSGLKAYVQNTASGNYEIVIKADDAIKVYAPNDSSYLFSYILDDSENMTSEKFTNLTAIENIEYLDTTRVINASHMFEGMSNVLAIDLSKNRFGNLKDLASIFKGCENLTTLELGTNFDTSKVTNMSSMFEDCFLLDEISTEKFDTAEVTDMSRMFYRAYSIESLDITGFDTRKVTNMLGMFYNVGGRSADALELNFDNFDTSNVTNMASMFSFANIATINIASFDTSNVESMAGMFAYSMNLKSLTFGSNFNTGKVKDMSYMFSHCSSLDSLDVSLFNTSSVKNMANMFEAITVENLNVSNFNTSNVENMAEMFKDALVLPNIDLTHFDTSNVKSMAGMFAFTGATNEYALNLSSFDTSNVEDMTSMFEHAYNLHTINVSNKFVIDKVTLSTNMFADCDSLAGSAGTVYEDSNPKDKTYAVIDGYAGRPGYLSGVSHIATFDAGAGYFPSKSTGGSKVTVATVSVYYGTVIDTIKPENPVSNLGYEFKGWRVKGGALIDLVYEFDSDMTFEAIYQSNKWTKVKLNAGLGHFANGDKEKTVYVEPGYDNKRFEEPTVTGYTFDNFYIDGKPITATWSNISNDEVEVEARYTPNNYYIVYNGNDSTSGAMPMEIATYGEPHKLSKNQFENDGWKFRYWTYFREGSSIIGEFIDDEAEVLNLTSEKDGVVRLTAVWGAKTFKVNFDGNGATEKKSPSIFGGNSEAPETRLMKPGKINEVAHSEALETKKEDNNGASAQRKDNMPNEEFEYGSGKLPQNMYERPGYRFLGWALSPDSSIVYNDKAEFGLNDTFEDEITLYARWLPEKEWHANLVLQANGGTINGVETAQLLMTYGETTPKPTIEKSGYIFDYWEKMNHYNFLGVDIIIGTGIKVDYPEVCDFTGIYVLKAHWKPDNFLVRFYDNFGENEYKEVIATVAEAFHYPETTIAERGNAKLLGWHTVKDATVPLYRKGGANSFNGIAKGAIVNYYAIWDRDQYKVRLHGIDPEKDIDDATNVKEETFTYGKGKYLFGIKESIATINNVEKVFSGWSTDRNATKMSYYDAAVSDRVYDDLLSKGQGITTDANSNKVVDLWPVWIDRLNASYIIFDGNKGTIKGNKAWTVTYEAGKPIEYPKKTDLFRKGYELDASGDWIDKDGNIFNETYAVAEGEIHLYANWEQKTYTIEYVGTGEDTILTATDLYGTSVSRIMPGGEDVVITDNNMFERPGYDFVGWDTNPEANTVVYKVGQVVGALGGADEVVKLYTVWQPKVYTIYYYDGEDNLIGTNSFIYTKNVRLLPNEGISDGTLDAGFTYEVNGEVKKFSSGQSVSADEFDIASVERNSILKGVAESAERNKGGLFGGSKDILFGDPSTGGGIILRGSTSMQIYNLTFDANGGVFSDNITTVKTATASYGEDLSGKWPENPTSYNDFLGWAVEFDDGTKIEWTDTVYTLKESITFKAQWSRGFTARLDANGGTFLDGSSEQKVSIRKNESTSKFEIPTYRGYDFDNYYVRSVGGETVLNSTWTYFANDETHVVAHWKPYNYKIVYDANGGTGYMPYEIATVNVAHSLATNRYVKDGYRFDGWYVEALNTTQAENTDVTDLTMVKNGVTYVRATWAPLTYDIVYNANEGTGYMAPDTGITYGTSHKLKANTFTKAGHDFRGWSLATGSDITYYDEATISDTTSYSATLNLYAEWIPNNDIYGRLKLHGNDGLINGASYVELPLRYHEALVEPILSRIGYKFTNWTDNAGNVVTYPTICNFTELELTANWAPIKYNVRYYANGGTFSNGVKDFVDVADIEYETRFNLKSTTDISRQYYTLSGWKQNTASGINVLGTGTEQSKMSLVDGATIDLYAMWTADTYNITLHQVDPAGSAMDVDTVQNFTYGETNNYLSFIANRIATVSDIGYEFAGWAVPSDRNKVKYFASQGADIIYEVEGTNTIDLWPVWVKRADIVYVTFDGNGGTINGLVRWVVPFATGSELVYPISENVYRKGYIHNGWLDSDKTTPYSNTIVDFNDDKTIYANWTPGNYTIEYIAVGGNGVDDIIEGSMAADNKSTAVLTTLTSVGYERTGYTFEGWDTSPDAKVAIYGDGETDLEPLGENGDTIKLYTVWKANEYTVTYKDYEDNVVGTDTLVYGSSITLPANNNVPIGHKDTGFELVGHTGVKFVSGATVTGKDLKIDKHTNLTTGIVLKGTVEKIVYVVTFDANGGTYPDGRSIATASITYGDRVSLVVPADPVNGLKVFSGYIVDGAYRDVNTLTYDYTSNKTFTADWNGTTYKIEYNKNAPISPDLTKQNVVLGTTMATQSALANRDTQINPNSLSIVGYNFIGWATESYTAKVAEQMRDNGDPRIIGNRGVLNLDKADGEVVTLYAMWARNKYRLVMQQNEDTTKSSIRDPYATSSYIYYDELLSDNVAFAPKTRTNYTFQNKWTKVRIAEPYARSKYNGTDYLTTSSVYRVTSNLTLYPLWTNDERVITLVVDPNEAKLPDGYTSNTFIGYVDAPLNTIGTTSEPKLANGNIVTPIATPYDMKIFDYWSTVRGDTTTKVDQNALYDGTYTSIYANVRYRQEYMLTYDANGGTGYMASSTMKEGIKKETQPNAFTKKGYIFGGWTDQYGEYHRNGSSIDNPTRALTLYANWDTQSRPSGPSGGGPGGGGGGGGGGGRLPAGSMKSDLDDGFSMQTPVLVTDYTFTRDEFGLPSGILLKRSSSLAKALLSSNDYTSRYKVVEGDTENILLKNGFYNIQRLDGSFFYLCDRDGKIKTGFVNVNPILLYTVDSTTNTLSKMGEADGGKYYLLEEQTANRGILYSEPIVLNGIKYLFDSAGRVLSETAEGSTALVNTANNDGWRYDPVNDAWSYYTVDSEGNVTTYRNGAYPILSADNNTYYYVFDDKGFMKTGLTEYNGNTYYLREDGLLKGSVYTGEITLNNKTYLFDSAGVMVTADKNVSALTKTEPAESGENRFIP